MSLFNRSAKTKVVSQVKIETPNLSYFEEDDFETNDDLQFDAFCTALSTVAERYQRSYPTLCSDEFSSLDGLI